MEIWKPVLLDGFEGLYEVSNIGRVRSLDRSFIRTSGRKQTVKGRILKQTKDKDGYCKVIFSNQGLEKNNFVHRLVAKAFIENPNNLPQVNHKNSKRDDNSVDNLEWVTEQGNSIHAYEYGNGLMGIEHPNSRQISLSYDGKIISIFESVSKCVEILNIPKKTLTNFIKEEKLLFGALIVDYVDFDFDEEMLNHNPFKRTISNLSRKPVCITDKNHKLIGVYESRSIAESVNNIPSECLMYPKQKNTLYKGYYYIKDISQYEYLTCDDFYVNRKI